MTKRINISTGSKWEPMIGYSRAVRIGNRIEVAGTTAAKGGEIVGVGSMYEQAKCILSIIEGALEEAGAKMSDVVRTRAYLTDMSKWEEVAKAHGEYFADIRPVFTMVEVNALADPEMLVEIEAEAQLID